MEIITRINWVDVLVAIIMIRMSYVAFREGLSHEIFPFFGSVMVMVFAMHYYTVFGFFLSRSMMNMPVELTNFISFLVIVLASGFTVKLLRVVLDKIVKVQWHPMIEKFGGLAVGMVKAYVITSIVLMVLALMPLSYLQWSIKDKSLTGKYFLRTGPEIYSRIGGFLPTASGKPANK